MAVPTVRLKIRVRLADGSRAYVDPAYSSNSKLKPLVALIDGKPIHHPEGVYHLRYVRAGKRVWEPVGNDPQLALTAKLRVEHHLQSIDLGLVAPDPIPAKLVEVGKRLLAECATAYIAETAEHKSVKTLAAYRKTVESFQASTAREYIEDINRDDLMSYISVLRKKGNAPRTIRNRVDFFQGFLHHYKLPSLLVGSDLPKYTRKKVRAYNELELGKMFGAATQDESDLLHFLLCTGAREQEAQYACWSDVDLERKTYTVTEHLDLGYRPKDKEEETLPIPDLLVDALVDRRKRYPQTRLIFPGKHGGPNGHALRTIKQLALRAGANCGECVNKKGRSCATHPVCHHILLHKMRKTFASVLHRNGLPAQTLQRYLRHSDLSTTLMYIADQPDEQVRGTINSTFSGFGVPDSILSTSAREVDGRRLA